MADRQTDSISTSAEGTSAEPSAGTRTETSGASNTTTTLLGHTGHTGRPDPDPERPDRAPDLGADPGADPGTGREPAAHKGPLARALRLFLRVLAVLAAFAAMVVFAAMLSRLTLEPSAAAERLTHTNLRPGDSIRGYFEQPDRWDAVRQLGGNLALGVPFGVLLPVMIPPARGALRITLCVALVMLAVELVQGTLVTGRAFDIDDVLLNATGALAGYLLLGRRMGRAVHPRARPERLTP